MAVRWVRAVCRRELDRQGAGEVHSVRRHTVGKAMSKLSDRLATLAAHVRELEQVARELERQPPQARRERFQLGAVVFYAHKDRGWYVVENPTSEHVAARTVSDAAKLWDPRILWGEPDGPRQWMLVMAWKSEADRAEGWKLSMTVVPAERIEL